MHLYLFVQPASDLHPWALTCSDACVRNTKAIQELIAQADSSSATCVAQLLPVERVGTPGMRARVA
jgi:hypothetical protein